MIMGRPTGNKRQCPIGECSGTFERLYVRRGEKRIAVGRKCDKCNHIVLDPYVVSK